MCMIDKEKCVAELFEEYKDAVLNAELPENAGGYSFVKGFGNATSSVVLVGEAPGKDEVLQGRPFVGQAGKILTHFLETAGIERDNLYITNIIKYRLAREGKRAGTLANRPASARDIEFSAPYLKREIDIIKPTVIVTLGNVPLKGFTDVCGMEGITLKDHHGCLTQVPNCEKTYLFPLYHPAGTIYRPELKTVYDADLVRLNEELARLNG